jgi:hypothetical protein
VPRYVAIKPAEVDTAPDGSEMSHPRQVWTYDGVIQIGTAEEWERVANEGLIEVPDRVAGAPVEHLAADHHEHIVQWWRDGSKVCLGVIARAAVSHAPDDGEHALVLGTPQEWARADWLWGQVKPVRVPFGTPGMTLVEHEAIVRPPVEDEVVS